MELPFARMERRQRKEDSSVSEIDVVVVVAGWEERFLKGLERDIATHQPRRIILLNFEEYVEMTRHNREILGRELESKDIVLQEATLRREPKEIWKTLRATFSDTNLVGKSVLLDISTMPREVIWWSLKFLQVGECKVEFVYHRPGSYSSEWLTRDTGEPRLVYQCSGIARLGQPTGLLLLSGFDFDRAWRLIQYFEPSVILLGIQSGHQFDNKVKNIDPSRALSRRTSLAKTFDVDAYGADWGFQSTLEAVHPHLKTHNIIAASLGPKVSAMSLFRLQSVYPEIALSYAPSRQFNPAYSHGIGTSVEGGVPFWSVASDSLAEFSPEDSGSSTLGE